VLPGDDLTSLIIEAALGQVGGLQQRDVLVITQKIVSKAEGRLVDLRDVTPSPFACQIAETYGKDARLVEIVLRESRRIVRMDHGVIITETKHGFVCANAGVDASNVPDKEVVALLPEDADRSAAQIRVNIRDKLGIDVAVIISDSFGRPWRDGIVDVAVGIAGMAAKLDYVDQKDPHGYNLRATVMATADELASAAELAMGKLDGVPVVLVRGYEYPQGEGKATDLVRAPELDMFR
jgi:coenzyme F420-0:L-glutamate ligase/coenzyme F420-1:gamma-L-glutamate ligase